MDGLFGWLSSALSGSIATALVAAFLWGIVSLAFDPSHLTAIPLLVAFISGDTSASRSRATVLSVLFGAGVFSAIVVAGFISVVAGKLVGDIGPWAMYLVAGVLFLTGLSLLDVLPPGWPHRHVADVHGHGGLAAFGLGLVFGLALGACTFTYLAPVLGAAFALGTHGIIAGMALVCAFALGHTLLIVVAGASAGRVHRVLAATSGTALRTWRYASAVLVILGGVYMLTIA